MDPQTPVQTQNQTPQPAPTAVAQPTLDTVPATWPGAWGLYKHSKKAMLVNIWPIIILYVITVVLSIVLQLINKNIGVIVADIIGIAIGVSIIILLLAGVHGEKLTIGQALSRLTPMLCLKYMASGILVGLITVVSLLLLIIPFFFVYPRLLLVPYLLVDRNLGPIEAISASWSLTKGNIGKVYGIIGVNIAIGLLLFTIIGIPFAIYFFVMYVAALPILSVFLAQHQPVAAVPAAPAPVTPVAPVVQ